MKTFTEMQLPEELQKALSSQKFVSPTPIQKEVIPIAITGKDIAACAETGSGKTGAYGIPMVAELMENPEKRALVLAPTRELVAQISEFLTALCRHKQDLQVATLVGGADIRRQFNALKKSPRIVVATPGRLIDHLNRKSLVLKSTEILVLDEGDRMLDMGFAPQLDEILKFLPKKRQSLLFTATLPTRVQKLAESYLNKPHKLNVGRTSLPVEAIKQSVIEVTAHDKRERIVDELNERTGSIIVFARTQHRTDLLASSLKEIGFKVDLIHGGRSQGQRNQAIRNFKSGRSRILCATDIAARGIDIPLVEHVINYDLPMMPEDYVHRIGRTARNGADGEAVSFVTPEDNRTWVNLAKKYRIQGVELKMPTKKVRQSQRGKYGSREELDGGGGHRKKRGASKTGPRSATAKRTREDRPFSNKYAEEFPGKKERGFKSKKSNFGSKVPNAFGQDRNFNDDFDDDWKEEGSNNKKSARGPRKPFGKKAGKKKFTNKKRTSSLGKKKTTGGKKTSAGKKATGGKKKFSGGGFGKKKSSSRKGRTQARA